MKSIHSIALALMLAFLGSSVSFAYDPNVSLHAHTGVAKFCSKKVADGYSYAVERPYNPGSKVRVEAWVAQGQLALRFTTRFFKCQEVRPNTYEYVTIPSPDRGGFHPIQMQKGFRSGFPPKASAPYTFEQTTGISVGVASFDVNRILRSDDWESIRNGGRARVLFQWATLNRGTNFGVCNHAVITLVADPANPGQVKLADGMMLHPPMGACLDARQASTFLANEPKDRYGQPVEILPSR